MRSAFLISRQWFVMAPRPNVAAKLATVGPCQTLACCSRWMRPRPRITLVAKYPSSLENAAPPANAMPSQRSEEHTSELQSHHDLVCRLLLETKNNSTW